jgi:photosystem II stability/assembly factor-like uncharacterized protein
MRTRNERDERTTRPRRPRRATPPKDNPRQRFAELEGDLFSGVEEMAAVADTEIEEARPSRRRLAVLRQLREVPTVLTPVAAGVSNWVQLGPVAIPNGQTYGTARVFVTGRITAIAIDPTQPQVISVGTARGGIWKTTDGGATWSPMSDNEVSLAIGALALAPSNPQVIYAGTGEGNLQFYVQSFPLSSSPDNYLGNGVLKSMNGGDTWAQQGSSDQQPAPNFDGAGFFRIAVHPTDPNVAFAATSNGLFRTTNGGGAWARLTNGLPAISASVIAACDVALDPSTPTMVYVAFFGDGVYKTTDGGGVDPSFTKQTGALPTTALGRIVLGIAPSSPTKVYALVGDNNEGLHGLYATTATGWAQVSVPLGSLGGQCSYNMDVTVDPTTPDILYVCDISLWKLERNPITNTWTSTDVGLNIHPDSHAVAFDPTNHLVIYAGNDGGIYKSLDGGAAWSDAINHEICITQFEFIDQHPTSDAVVIGGTQDNGTEIFRNSPVFYHSDEGDGGFVAIDANQPGTMFHGYFGRFVPARSTQAGDFGTWTEAWPASPGSGLFYSPFVLDQSNPQHIALGRDRVFLDAAQGTGGWGTQVALPGLTGRVSALSYVDSNLIYAATTSGRVYRLVRAGGSWTVTSLHAAPLPNRWIWDVAPLPGAANTIVVVMAGFGTGHVWQGVIPATGAATWTDISGTAMNRLPDIPINALAIDPAAAGTMYVGTDVGVFRTTNGGTTWTLFSSGLPNCAVYDLKLHAPTHLLRAGTHGRGLWERRLDVATLPDVQVFVRDHVMDTGRITPTPSANATFTDPLQQVVIGDPLQWYQCADIKVDALEGSPLAYQMNVADVDYLAFDSRLAHRNPQRGRVNRVYVQVHNRGVFVGNSVTVKLLYADAAAGLPALPADFWTAFPADSTNTTPWHPIGAAQTVSVSPTEPKILEWDWTPPASAADHSCLLVVMDTSDDPIPPASKIFHVDALVPNERRVGLKNLHVVNAVPGSFYWTPFRFHPVRLQRANIRVVPRPKSRWGVGLLFPQESQTELAFDGFEIRQLTAEMLAALQERIGLEIERYDTTRLYALKDPRRSGQLRDVRLPDEGLAAMLLFMAPPQVRNESAISIEQEEEQQIVGGNTFVVRTVR